MKLTSEFYIKAVAWSTHEPALRQIRQQVFIDEQKVPEALEWDTHDAAAIHLLAIEAKTGQTVACARLINRAIGRMAVKKPWRGLGIGRAILNHAIAYYRQQNCQQVQLSAQTHAISFYEQAGFKVISKPYLDANIWHVDMQLDI